MKLILGSASPRRAELLRYIGLPFTVSPSHASEHVANWISSDDYVSSVAREKGRELSSRFPDDCILCADTVVVLGMKILGKPGDKDEALEMLKNLAGKTHEVKTAVYIAHADKVIAFVETTKVRIAPMSKAEMLAYIATKEPFDKAGGYGIQGVFSRHVEEISGNYDNVVGLPVHRVYQALKTSGWFPELG